MSKNLLIVESPAKAKTIEKILGKDFTVKSSYGHVRDLPKNDKAVDIESGFTPKYIVTPDKTKVVTELKSWVKKVDEVWLATDEDREGEAISWHLCQVLGLDEKKTKRIVFREITAPAIQQAIKNPRTVDMNLVDAQQARRILDRLVGFELSELLWKKVKGKLSAGRVQSVSVRLIVEREREILDFNAKSSYRVVAIFNTEFGSFKAELAKRLETLEEARDFLQHCISANFTVSDLEQKPAKKSPAAPFTTSTLQQEASRKLGFSVSQTMVVAQRLYESGKITYMRTDSVNLSDTALNMARSVITDQYGAEFAETRKFTQKTKGAQEAHEAIRPTDMAVMEAGSDRNEQRLYDLIWKRTVASQMADARIEKTTITIDVSGS
ncbi:MAG: type I DNA topoisomerase, partial [Saprospiraceae bacterium]|nr:type I DNA topoisomerase [Saprospiraceae bacterium]